MVSLGQGKMLGCLMGYVVGAVLAVAVAI